MKKGNQRATFADLEGLPETVVGEIIDGELFVSPRPAGPHTFAASNLSYDLIGPFHRGIGGPGGWWIVNEPELHFGEDAVIPDLAGWRKERMGVYPSTASVALAPDWLCEVLSPSTARIDRKLKLKVYARERVKHVWILDPVAKTLEVYRLDGEHWTLVDLYTGPVPVRAEPFEAFELNLSALWLPEVHSPTP